jgi:hypothetical protein
VRACQPKVPTLAQVKAPDALREAGLDPGPQGILGFELGGFLSLSGGLDGLVVGLQPDGELPRGVFRRGARRAGGTRATYCMTTTNAKRQGATSTGRPAGGDRSAQS